MIEQFKKEYEAEDGVYSVHDLASFVDDNWNELTGLTNRDKDSENDFPSEVSELIYELELDYDDFSQAWSSVREGAEDWEDEDEDEFEYHDTESMIDRFLETVGEEINIFSDDMTEDQFDEFKRGLLKRFEPFLDNIKYNY